MTFRTSILICGVLLVFLALKIPDSADMALLGGMLFVLGCAMQSDGVEHPSFHYLTAIATGAVLAVLLTGCGSAPLSAEQERWLMSPNDWGVPTAGVSRTQRARGRDE